MANLVKNILEMLTTAGEVNLDWFAPLKIADAVLTFRENSEPSDYTDIMREKSKAAYDAYCQDREAHSRGDSIGLPDQEPVLSYWERCMNTNTFPNSQDFAAFADASAEESEQMLKFLMGQWMTVPDFTIWLSGIANRLKLDEISRTLEILPRLDNLTRQMAESLKNISENGRGISKIQYITYNSVIEARTACTDKNTRDYYRITNEYNAMFRTISAGRDIPHKAACAKLDELLQEDKPVIIAGNGGLGKSSLMLRTAIQWAEAGGVAVWLPLSASSADAISESQAREFYDALLRSATNGANILLCIENPYEGFKASPEKSASSFNILRKKWLGDKRIHLLMAERSSRLFILGGQNNDCLIGWFDNAYVLELQSAEKGDNAWFQEWFQERGYHYLPFPEENGRRRRILDACITIRAKEIPREERDQKINLVLQQYDHSNVSLAELIYRALFEMSKFTSKAPDVLLDWDEWERFLHETLNIKANSNMYGVIAAFKLFDTPLTLSFFCCLFKNKKIDEWDLQNALDERAMSNQIEPVFYDSDNKTLQPKHDVIAELFFLFHKDTVSINRLMQHVIQEMNSEETEILLDQMVDKQEFLRGSAYQFDIRYQDYLNQIQKRMESRQITLGSGGRANLCTGNFWLKLQQACNQEEIREYLVGNAPSMESFVRGKDFFGINFHGMARLYTEWGMWEQSRGNFIEAEQRFKDVLTMGMKEETLFARTVLGQFLAKQDGRKTEAEAVFQKALELDPNNIYALTGLGRLLAGQRGRETDAEDFLRKVLEIDPDNIPTLIVLAELYTNQGKFSEAEKLYKKVCRIDPGNRRAKDAIAREKFLKKYRGKSPRWKE